MPLPSVKSIVNTVSSFAADAYSNLTSSADRSSLTTATKTRSSLGSHAEPIPPLAHVASPRMSEGVKFHTRSVTRFLEEFEAEDRAHEATSDSQDLKDTLTLQSTDVGISKRTTLHTAQRDRSSRRSEERRLLGLPEKSPTDAVKISPPMSRVPFLSKQQLRPQNTLNQPKSSRHEFYMTHTGKNVSPTNSAGSRKKSVDGFRENNHEQPLKKRRVGDVQEVDASSREVIDLDEDDALTAALTQTKTSSDPIRSIGGSTTPRGGLQRVPSKHFTIDLPKPNTHSRKRHSSQSPPHLSHHFKARRSSSPDALLAEDFIKSARRERMDEIQQTTVQTSSNGGQQTKSRYDKMLASSSPEISEPIATPRKKNRVKLDESEEPEFRIGQGPQTEDDSPDALQNDAITGASPMNGISRFRNVKSTNSLSTHRLHSRERVKSTQRAKSAASKHIHVSHPFRLARYAYPGIPSSKSVELFVDATERSLNLNFINSLLDAAPMCRIFFARIAFIEHDSEQAGTQIIVHIRGNSKLLKPGFEFDSHKTKEEFRRTLTSTDSTIKFQHRNEDYLRAVFSKCSQHHVEDVESLDEHRQQAERSQATSSPTMHNEMSRNGLKSKRLRLVDTLNTSENQSAARGPFKTDTDQTQTVGVLEQTVSKHESARLAASAESVDGSASLESRRPQRMTRSRIVDMHDSTAEAYQTIKKPSVFETLDRWKKPLVYPLTGKKRETVQFDDLQRLDEDEFLNDNLVSLFIRYLEEHAPRDIMKKVHFFNSFLFEALTKGPKARRGINFDAVRRWTVKVDLFSRDFVVVPVNENLHWFVMIICNLSYFKRMQEPKEEEDEEEEEEVDRANSDEDDIVEVVQKIEKDKPERILESDLKQDLGEASARSSFAEMSLDDQPSATSQPNSVRSANVPKGRKRHTRRSLPKYALNKPVIITLDSLDHARSSIASTLRQYIVAEAKDKQNWDIDPNEIKGMTAKGIPHQNNFSDCGLYLCMYLEQFMLQPYEFVRRILQRSNETKWPEHIASSNLRDRLRNMLITLHDEQHNSAEQKFEIPPLGSIMVQMSTPEKDEDLHELNPSTIRAARERYNQGQHLNPAQRPNPEQENVSMQDGAKMIESMDEWKNVTNNPILINDDPQPQLKPVDGRRETASKSPYFAHSDQIHVSSPRNVDSHSSAAENDPIALARKLKRQRSPEASSDGEVRTFAEPAEKSDVTLTAIGTKDAERQESSSSQATSLSRFPPRTSASRKEHLRFKKQSDDGGRDTIEEERVPARVHDLYYESHVPLDSNSGETTQSATYIPGTLRSRQALQEITTSSEKEEEQIEDEMEGEPIVLI